MKTSSCSEKKLIANEDIVLQLKTSEGQNISANQVKENLKRKKCLGEGSKGKFAKKELFESKLKVK